MIKLGIIGHPVSHSLSPRIHQWIADRSGYQLSYDRIETTVSDVASTISTLRQEGFSGVNVTSPLKTAVIALADDLAPIAQQTMSVNTLRFDLAHGIQATNTDVYGFAYQLGTACPDTIGVLGAGGVVPSVLSVLQQQTSARVHLFNRRIPRDAIRQQVEQKSAWFIHGWDEFYAVAPRLKILINCLPAVALPLIEQLPMQRLPRTVRIIDLNYGETAELFRGIATDQQLPYEDGLKMLCAQAFQAFQYWMEQELEQEILTQLTREIVEIASA